MISMSFSSTLLNCLKTIHSINTKGGKKKTFLLSSTPHFPQTHDVPETWSSSPFLVLLHCLSLSFPIPSLLFQVQMSDRGCPCPCLAIVCTPGAAQVPNIMFSLPTVTNKTGLWCSALSSIHFNLA